MFTTLDVSHSVLMRSVPVQEKTIVVLRAGAIKDNRGSVCRCKKRQSWFCVPVQEKTIMVLCAGARKDNHGSACR
jgi:hypothetical protein